MGNGRAGACIATHAVATAVGFFDEAAALQLGERLAGWSAADPELRGDGRFLQPRAAFDPPIGDLPGEDVERPLVEPRGGACQLVIGRSAPVAASTRRFCV